MKTMKQFKAEWEGVNEVNRFFTFKPWFGEHEGETVRVAVARCNVDGWLHAVHAELKDGTPFEMVATGGMTKSDLLDSIMGC